MQCLQRLSRRADGSAGPAGLHAQGRHHREHRAGLRTRRIVLVTVRMQNYVVSCGWEKKLCVDRYGTADCIHSEVSEYAFGRCVVHPSNRFFAVGAYQVTPADQDCVLVYEFEAAGIRLLHRLADLGRYPYSIRFTHSGALLAASNTTGMSMRGTGGFDGCCRQGDTDRHEHVDDTARLHEPHQLPLGHELQQRRQPAGHRLARLHTARAHRRHRRGCGTFHLA